MNEAKKGKLFYAEDQSPKTQKWTASTQKLE